MPLEHYRRAREKLLAIKVRRRKLNRLQGILAKFRSSIEARQRLLYRAAAVPSEGGPDWTEAARETRAFARSAFERARLKKSRWPTSAKEEQREGVVLYLAARKKRQQHRSTQRPSQHVKP
jgi:hypothetical protein